MKFCPPPFLDRGGGAYYSSIPARRIRDGGSGPHPQAPVVISSQLPIIFTPVARGNSSAETISPMRVHTKIATRPLLPGAAALLVLMALVPWPGPRAAASAQAVGASPAQATRLEAGRKLEREIRGGEAHAYSVVLHRGAFLRAVATSQGVDVSMKLYGPGGDVLMAVDLLKYAGPEPVSFEAGAEGEYRLEVRGGGAAASSGRYELTSEVKPGATGADRERGGAERLLVEAARLEREGTKESLELSVVRYSEAAAKWRTLGERYWEAYALHYSGRASNNLGERRKALDYYEQSLPIRRAVGDHAGEASTLNNIGLVYRVLGERRKALEYFEQSLLVSRAIDDRDGEARTLNNIGIVYNALGEQQKALEYYEQALSVSRALGDRAGEAGRLANIGIVYDELGQGRKALEYYKQALPILRSVGDRRGEADTLTNIGTAYDRLGEGRKALEYFEQALPTRRALGDRRGEAATLGNIGNAYVLLGEERKALKYYEQSLPILRAIGDRADEANTLHNIGLIYKKLGEERKALEYYEQALPISRAVGDRPGEARTLSELMLHRDLGNPTLAVFYGKQAVNTYQQLRSFIQGLDKEIQKTYLSTVEDTYRRLADLLLSQGRLMEAERVLSLLKEEEYSGLLRRRDGPPTEVGYSPAEAAAIKVLAQLGDLGRERGELAVLKEKQALDDKGKLRLRDLDRELLPKATAEYNRALEAVGREGSSAAAKIAVVKDEQSLSKKLREMGLGTVALYTIISTEAGRSARGWVMLVTPDFRKAFQVDVKEIDRTVLDLRSALRTPLRDPRPAARRLYRMLFLTPQPKGLPTLEAELEAYLKNQNERTLMWSLDGPLRYVPVAALSPDGTHYLVERYRNVVFTPASIPTLSDPVSQGWRALGLGTSKSYEVRDEATNRKVRFEALGGVSRELAAIVRDRPGGGGVLPGVAKLDEQFSKDAMLDGLGEGYPVVHIASHFHYEPADPNRSFLLLGDGRPLEMSAFNDAGQIFERTELLTLSACDTAMGGTAGGDGREVEGLGYVAQRLGAQAVIASLWPVDDVGTQVLMPEFYRLRQERGLAKAEALRRAQLSLLNGTLKDVGAGAGGQSRIVGYKVDPAKPYAHPYYWAPFILIGNWR